MEVGKSIFSRVQFDSKKTDNRVGWGTTAKPKEPVFGGGGASVGPTSGGCGGGARILQFTQEENVAGSSCISEYPHDDEYLSDEYEDDGEDL